MTPNLKSKILSLYNSGFRSIISILQELKVRPKIIGQTTEPRTHSTIESEFKTLIVPAIVTAAEFSTFPSKTSLEKDIFLKQKLESYVAAGSTTAEKFARLTNCIKVNSLRAILKEQGSGLFGDADFEKTTRTVQTVSDGQNWLEANGETEPSEEEIRKAILS